MVTSPTPIPTFADSDRDTALSIVIEGVKSIGDQVRYHLTHLPGECLNRSLRAEIGLHHDLAIFNLARIEAKHVIHHLTKHDVHRGAGLAIEAKCLPDNVDHAPKLLLRQFH